MNISSYYQRWRKFELSASSVANRVAGLFLALMLLITVADIIARVVWKPIIGVWEIVALLLVPVVFMAFSYALLTDSHIKVTVLVDRLPARIQNSLAGVVSLMGSLVIGLISWRLFIWAHQSWVIKEPNWGSIDVPMYPVKFLAALGCVPFAFLFLEAGIRHLVKAVRRGGS